eukprot:TRINITY_DN56021_c0_g1_i1.p1 TRINITY_DN56021_c0_g1~~TRINITY_DN56021_c0_g1_i1.p1  ORF type:complete len:198 (-),score=30.88 TRINITY_DN56021_c0_g1_i1:54-647(-)
MRRVALRRLFDALPERSHVLDAGCGAGVPTAQEIIAHPKQFRVTGIDISRRQIELAETLVDSERAAFECVDMALADFPEASFDAVCAFFSVFHLPRQEHACFFRRVVAWLKPGGMFVFNMGSGLDDGDGEASLETDFLGVTMLWSSFSFERTRTLLLESGLELVHHELRTVSSGDEVDAEGMQFRFYVCQKSTATKA